MNLTTIDISQVNIHMLITDTLGVAVLHLNEV